LSLSEDLAGNRMTLSTTVSSALPLLSQNLSTEALPIETKNLRLLDASLPSGEASSELTGDTLGEAVPFLHLEHDVPGAEEPEENALSCGDRKITCRFQGKAFGKLSNVALKDVFVRLSVKQGTFKKLQDPRSEELPAVQFETFKPTAIGKNQLLVAELPACPRDGKKVTFSSKAVDSLTSNPFEIPVTLSKDKVYYILGTVWKKGSAAPLQGDDDDAVCIDLRDFDGRLYQLTP
jgi:hypothetical protein